MESVKEEDERLTTEWVSEPQAFPAGQTSALETAEPTLNEINVSSLVEELRLLRIQVVEQEQQLRQLREPMGLVGEDSWMASPPPPSLASPSVALNNHGYAQLGSDKDLYRLAKMVKCIVFEPRDEREYDDTLEEWESKSRGCGMQSGILRNLLIHVGALKVRQAVAEIPVATLPWPEVKNRVARLLFPFSRYRRDLEREIEEESRGPPVDDVLVLLAKNRKRHSDLCIRWSQTNTLSDDRMKDALLVKLPLDKVVPCLSIKDFHGYTYEEFALHCKMITAALEAGAKASKKPTTRSSIKSVAPAVQSVHVAAVEGESSEVTPKRSAPSDYVCYNYNEKGHYAKNCPHPKVKCASCGRLGHNSSSCTKLQHDGPLGRTRTGFLRMTRGGIHLDLIDEATKRALFDSMRKHLELQEQATEKAKIKAKAKRDEKKAAEAQKEIVIETPMEEVDLFTPETKEKVRKIQDISRATFEEPERQLISQYIDVQIFGYKFPSLLDSGAVISLLPLEIWEALPLENKGMVAQCNPGQQPLIGLGGSFPVETIVDLPIVVGPRALVQRFFVSSAPNTPILGIDALSNLEIQIDYATHEVTFPEGKQQLKIVEPLGVSRLCSAQLRTVTEDNLTLYMGEGSNEMEQEEMLKIFGKYKVTWENPTFGKCTSTLHHIDTGTATPIRTRLRRLPPEKRGEVKEQLENLMKKGVIRPSNSPWASAVVLVPKANGTTRLCVDYRALNDVTIKDAFPLPRITELLDKLATATIFSTLDLAAGFHQIPLDDESIPKTAFITPEGLFEFLVLPFGLANAPSTFQRMTDALFREPPLCDHVSVYIDDIVVFTTDLEHHYFILSQVLQKLADTHLFVNLEKTVLCARKVKYLGFIVEAGELSPDERQIKALKLLQEPTDVPAVRRFLGLTSYFRHFIPEFSTKVLPLTKLLKKNTPFQWASSQQVAWENLRNELASNHVRLILPILGKIFILDTDASNYALGAVIMQEDKNGELRPVAYASRTLSTAEQNWTTREQEAYAVVWGILHFAHYLRAQPHFIVRTDHQSLRWLWHTDNKRIIRWALLLREYNFTIQHNKGAHHQHVDIFSRDVTPNEGEDLLVERVATPQNVFCANFSAATPISLAFPSFDDILTAQKEECTPEVVESCKLRKGAQGLWQSHGGQAYIPASLRNSIMYYFHFSKAGAHQGVNRVFSRIRKHFYWPGLKDSLQAYHAHCLTCARRKPKPPVGDRGYLLAAHVGGVVALDVVGPMQIRGESISFLTMIDHFSQYPHAASVSRVTSTIVWETLYTQWISYFGAPAYILMDNATVFRSAEFKKKVKEIGGTSLYTFPYHPEGNGVVESFHLYFKRSLVAALRLTTAPLSTILADILAAYRATPHPSTGESPFYLLTGMDMILPCLQEWTPDSTPTGDIERAELLHQLREEAFDNTARKAVARKEGKRGFPDLSELKPGALVLYWLQPPEKHRTLQSKVGTMKTRPLWSAPCRVLRKATTRDNTYIIRSLWYKIKPKVVPQEELLEITGSWTIEKAQEALKELLADLKINRQDEDLMTTTASELRPGNPELPKSIVSPSIFVEELIREPNSVEDDIEEEPTSLNDDDSILESKTTLRAKRPRTAHCITWGELNACLPSGNNGPWKEE